MNRATPTIEGMKRGIEKAGGLFYQYRPCRRDVATIYDIENIRHGVVYAQTPLNMNDPFDSMIGFSTEKIYEECISAVMDASKIENENTKTIIAQLLKHRLIGKTAEFLIELNNLKKYLFGRRLAMHQTQLSMEVFIAQNANLLYSKCPASVKKVFNKDAFFIFSLLVCNMGKTDITESVLNDMLKFDDILDEFEKKVVEVRETRYVPAMQDFLSKLTVSCFSISGWDNQLMWSHYANSYKGICVEYDFTKVKDFIGFIYPVEYTTNRPTLSLYDMGIKRFNLNSEHPIEQSEPDMGALLTYLLAKNTCWNYEKEWRIINIGEPYTPEFINLPYIKSITFGLDVDPICKHLLLDVCQEKGIECYDILPSTEDFTLSRVPVNSNDYEYNIDTEVAYIDILSRQISQHSEKIQTITKSVKNTTDSQDYDFSQTQTLLSTAIDMLTNAYYLKISLNRFCDNSDEDLSNLEVPQDILDVVLQINNFSSSMTILANSLTKSLPNLRILGKISVLDYPIIQTQISNIKELAEKLEIIQWNPIYLTQEPIILEN